MSETTATNAATSSTTSATMDMLVIVSSVLSDFLEENAEPVVLESSLVLKTLMQNATKTTDDPKKEALYRRVRLANPKIQQNVTNVNGALDILSLAGFQETIETTGEKVLLYAPPPKTQQDGELATHHEVLKALINGLEAKLKELEPQLEELEAKKRKAKKQTAVVIQKPPPPKRDDKDSPNPFLGEEERRLRVERAKAAKKAREAERKATKERLEENKRERKEAAERREAALKAAAVKEAQEKSLATGINIRRKNANNMPLAKPFEPAAGSDPEAQRKALAAAARANKDRQQQAPQQGQVLGGKATPTAAAPPPQAATAALQANDMNIESAAKLPPQESKASFASKPAGLPKSTPMEVDDDDKSAEDKKPAARKRPAQDHNEMHRNTNAPMDCNTEWTWEYCLEHLPRCAAATGIRETSHFRKRSGEGLDDANAAAPMCLKTLFKELDSLKTSLPTESNASIWIRFDEEMPQYIRALIAAPLPGPTPYSGGMFAFDIFVPGNYPQVPPKVQILTTGGGKMRFGPNLYAEGKVCLSLLGTWEGPKWDPKHSSLYQVLISIQGLLLGVEHPYFLEPGHGGWEGQIKDGSFQTKGQTLRGDTVVEEIGVPQKAVLYEDKLRVGTVKYAMLDLLKYTVEEEASKKSSNKYLEPFAKPIEAHFYQNGNQIIPEVQSWLSDGALGRNRQSTNESLPIDQLHDLLPNLEKLLSTLIKFNAAPPSLGQKPSGSSDFSPSREPKGAKLKKAPEEDAVKSSDDVAVSAMDEGPEQKEESSGEGLDVLEPRRQRMREAATRGDFVLAGELQEEIKRIEDLHKSMTEAAAQQDFIRAGRLQAQFKALTTSDEPATSITSSAAAAAAQHFSEDESNENSSVESDDESMDEAPMGGMGMALGGLPQPGPGAGGQQKPPPPGLGKWIFAPPSRLGGYAVAPNYKWGGGNQLSADDASADRVSEDGMTQSTEEEAPAKKALPPDLLCRLRIRLPGDKSVVEDFDKNDILSAVYRRIAPKVEEQSRGRKGSSTPVAARLAGSGAFAQPLSSTGFTLLLTRPKREFSLEMHGTKTLAELNLAPSATLTVMHCSDRGVLHRGELEARLRQAQGNAIDVEGLTYEALVELTERLGTAAPSGENAFVSISTEDLESNSQTFRPAQYLAALDDSMEETGEDERRCPICLGCYDATEETESLRRLNNCSHVFHSACLETWLCTKSSCPLCKTSVVSEA